MRIGLVPASLSLLCMPLAVADRDGSGRWEGGARFAGTVDLDDDGVLDILLKASCGFDLEPRGLFANGGYGYSSLTPDPREDLDAGTFGCP